MVLLVMVLLYLFCQVYASFFEKWALEVDFRAKVSLRIEVERFVRYREKKGVFLGRMDYMAKVSGEKGVSFCQV